MILSGILFYTNCQSKHVTYINCLFKEDFLKVCLTELSGVNYTLYTMYVIWIVRCELYVIYNVRYMNCQVW